MYTKEQNEEIEKVCRVFDSYIRENPYFDELKPYMAQLPECTHLVTELFRE